MSSSSIIAGMVQDAQGRPIGAARVYFVEGPVDVPDIAALTDDDGRFTLSAPAPGTYQIQVASEGFTSTTAMVDVRGEQWVDLNVRLSS
jgi:carboxypeptidase family protein